MIVADDYSALNRTGISPGILALCAVAFAALLVRGRGKVLNVWLLVVMAAWLCDVALSATIGSARYDLGWYGGRLFGLLAASFVLAALLLEMHRLYASLAEALEQSRAHAAELMRSRADLARAQRLEAIGELTGGIAHDFNNLLTAIVGGLGFILRNPEDHARVRRLGENAMKAAERGTRLIQQLLSFSRRQNLNPETVNPNALLTDFQSLAQAATGEPITLELNLDRLVHPVRVDVGEFQAAILNLLVNARDALPDGGTVRLETRNVALGRSEAGEDVNPGEHVMISVTDAGIGMDAQTQARAFEPFFTTKNIGQGSGLGLSQVFGFAKSAGGHLKVTSELGFGTTVSLYLPRSNEAVFQPTEPEGSIIRRASTGETVLLVEDDEVVSLASAENLRDLGYRLLTADNAARALDILRGSGRIDILFSDVVMPGGMNGVQLAVEARRLRPEIKVLLTSGFTGGVLARDAMALDVPLLDKPYRQDALAAKLWLVLRTG